MAAKGAPNAPRGNFHRKKFEKYTPAFKFMSSRLLFNSFIFIAAVLLSVLVDKVAAILASTAMLLLQLLVAATILYAFKVVQLICFLGAPPNASYHCVG